LGALLVVNATLGFTLSPITSITRVRVKNALPSEEASSRASLERLQGIPYALIHWGWVENRLTLSGAVSRVEHSGTPFGRAVLTLQPTRPVAAIMAPESLSGLFLSDSGRIFASDIDGSRLPQIELPMKSGTSSLSLAAGWEAGHAAGLSRILTENWPGEAWRVVMRDDSSFGVSNGRQTKRLGSLSSPEDALPGLIEAFGSHGASQPAQTESNQEGQPEESP
jgi:hypothetical protein